MLGVYVLQFRRVKFDVHRSEVVAGTFVRDGHAGGGVAENEDRGGATSPIGDESMEAGDCGGSLQMGVTRGWRLGRTVKNATAWFCARCPAVSGGGDAADHPAHRAALLIEESGKKEACRGRAACAGSSTW